MVEQKIVGRSNTFSYGTNVTVKASSELCIDVVPLTTMLLLDVQAYCRKKQKNGSYGAFFFAAFYLYINIYHN